jgi:hypothetical protein
MFWYFKYGGELAHGKTFWNHCHPGAAQISAVQGRQE